MRRSIKSPKRKYLILLEETRSIAALISGMLIFACAFVSIYSMAQNYDGTYEYPLNYFTVWANILSAVAAAFMIPYAVAGIKEKRFILPRWILLFQYAGASCLAVTLISAIMFILPTQGANAVSGNNFWLHIITPALTVILFQCVETGTYFKRGDMIFALLPFGIYMAVYFFMVVVLGKEKGGWSDFYKTLAFWPGWISALIMAAIAIAASGLLRVIHNKRAEKSWGKIKKMWGENLEPVQLLIECFGLGRYMGAKYTGGNLNLPLDIFKALSEQYGIPVDRLSKAYLKGALDAARERNNY